MPTFGNKDGAALLDRAPKMTGLDTAPWEIEKVEILNLIFELNHDVMEDVLPKALHPTIPPIVYFSMHKFPDSPVGPFLLAQTRIGCRAGVRPRGFLTQAFVDTQPAADALASQWGFAVRVADVALHRYHDRIVMTVADGGRVILDASLVTPDPISGADVQYVANMHIAQVDDKPLLVQVDPEFTFHKAERGRPLVSQWDSSAWNAAGARAVYPVSASFAVADTGFPAIRYVVNPDVPALAGSRKVNQTA